MKLTTKQQGHLVMLFVMTIFGLNIPVTKEIFIHHYMSPVGLISVRIFFGAVMFWTVSFFFPRQKVRKKDMVVLVVGGVCGSALNKGLFAYGLLNTSPVDASIITTSSPIFAMIIAAVLLHEPITLKKVGGVVLAAAGAIWLVIQSSSFENSANGSDMVGNLAIVGSQFLYAFYLVITKPLSLRYYPITMMKWIFGFSALAALPFTWREAASSPIFHSHDPMAYWMLAFVLVGATFTTFLLIPVAQQRIRATTISVYNNLQPLITTIVAVWLGIDTFTISKLLSALLVFGGVYFVTKSQSRADVSAPKEPSGDQS